MMVPAVFLISVGLLGIEDLGVQIEEPFSILPLEKICNTAQARDRRGASRDALSYDRGWAAAPSPLFEPLPPPKIKTKSQQNLKEMVRAQGRVEELLAKGEVDRLPPPAPQNGQAPGSEGALAAGVGAVADKWN